MSPLFRRKRRARQDEAGPHATALDPSPHAEDPTAVHTAPQQEGSIDAASTRERSGPVSADATTQQESSDAARTDDTAAGSMALAPISDDLDGLVGEAPTSRRRSRLRRRLRHLRRVRELLLRDLGGVVFEIHKAGAEADTILQAKLRRLAGVDAELRELEGLLDDRRAMTIREPGIGGSCPECGELYGSEARYCWACGSTVAPGEGGVPHLAAYVGAAGAAPTAIEPAASETTEATAHEIEDAETLPDQPAQASHDAEPPAHAAQDWLPDEGGEQAGPTAPSDTPAPHDPSAPSDTPAPGDAPAPQDPPAQGSHFTQGDPLATNEGRDR